MARILLACFEQSDHQTLLPLLRHLRESGHQTALLLPLVNPPNTNQLSVSAVFGHQVESNSSRSRSENPRVSIHPDSDEGSVQARVAELLSLLYPPSDIDIPFEVHRWFPEYKCATETALTSFRPDVVVIAMGRIETPVVRGSCSRNRIPCAWQLPLYYEFKSIEPFIIYPEQTSDDIFFVSGPYGRQKLVARGVPADRIIISGNPAFDQHASAIDRKRSILKPAAPTILHAMQNVPEDVRLLDRVTTYVNRTRDVSLISRFHPSTSNRQRQRMLSQSYAGERCDHVEFSEGRSLAIDLERCSVLLTISSLTAIDAMLLDRPVVCWAPSFLPPEIPFVETGHALIAHHSDELFAILDAVLPSLKVGEPGSWSTAIQQYVSLEASSASVIIERRLISHC